MLRHRQARFALVGIAATAIHGATLGLLTSQAHVRPLFANTTALCAAAVLSYVGHRAFTFRSSAAYRKSIGKFLAQVVGAWIVTSAVAVIFIPLVGSWPVSGFVMILVPCLNYLVYERWTFR